MEIHLNVWGFFFFLIHVLTFEHPSSSRSCVIFDPRSPLQVISVFLVSAPEFWLPTSRRCARSSSTEIPQFILWRNGHYWYSGSGYSLWSHSHIKLRLVICHLNSLRPFTLMLCGDIWEEFYLPFFKSLVNITEVQ